MQCYVGSNKETYVNYVVNFCWLHRSHYIEKLDSLFDKQSLTPAPLRTLQLNKTSRLDEKYLYATENLRTDLQRLVYNGFLLLEFVL